MKLTDLAVKNLAVESGQRTFFDDALKGFGVRVSPKSKTFVLVIHRGNRNKWETLGKYPVVSLAKARDEARNRLSAVQLGIRPKTPVMTFEAAYTLFLATYKAKNRAKTVYEMERIVKRHFMPKLNRHPLGDITTQDLTAIIDKLLPTPSECAATFTAARTLFRWIARRRLIERSPLEAVPFPVRTTSRDRVLTDDELRAVWVGCHSPTTFTQIVKLLILTGQRKTQIAHLRAEWIDRPEQTITWPAPMMKAGAAHTIPFGPLAGAILAALPEKGLLFPARGKQAPFNGFSKCTAAFNRKCEGIAPWVLHDLRRTFSTGLAKLRVPPHIKEMILAHATAKGPVEAIYDRHTYEDEMREALEKWEAHLARLLDRSELGITGERCDEPRYHQLNAPRPAATRRGEPRH